jgi:hypothetical protein
MNELIGKRVAIFDSDGFEHKHQKAQQFLRQCTREGAWVSGPKPDDLPLFNRETVKLFSESAPEKAMNAARLEGRT